MAMAAIASGWAALDAPDSIVKTPDSGTGCTPRELNSPLSAHSKVAAYRGVSR